MLFRWPFVMLISNILFVSNKHPTPPNKGCNAVHQSLRPQCYRKAHQSLRPQCYIKPTSPADRNAADEPTTLLDHGAAVEPTSLKTR